MASQAEMVDVTVKVPAARLGTFYEMYGRWLEDRPEPAAIVPTAPPAPPPPLRQPWDPDQDFALAIAVWKQFPSRAKAVFGTLIDHPGERFSAAELADRHAIPNGKYGIAGVLAHPGRQVRKVGRTLHIQTESGSEATGATYWMEPELAAMFGDAREQAEA